MLPVYCLCVTRSILFCGCSLQKSYFTPCVCCHDLIFPAKYALLLERLHVFVHCIKLGRDRVTSPRLSTRTHHHSQHISAQSTCLLQLFVSKPYFDAAAAYVHSRSNKLVSHGFKLLRFLLAYEGLVA